MAWWIYKCNNTRHPHQVLYGDWSDYFANPSSDWGSTERVPPLAKLVARDRIFAYQTDRNEVLGLVEVAGFRPRGKFLDLFLRPLHRLKSPVKVRPLKITDPRIAKIRALQRGPIKTIYELTDDEASALLDAVGIKGFQPGPHNLRNPVDVESEFVEGERRAYEGTVRNPKLRAAAKRKWGLACFCCGFEFESFYGTVGSGCAVVHHLQLFTDADNKGRAANIRDVRVVCANCHLVIHRTTPPIEIDKLREMMVERWDPWSDKGIKRKLAFSCSVQMVNKRRHPSASRRAD